jgi:hypothetical protein
MVIYLDMSQGIQPALRRVVTVDSALYPDLLIGANRIDPLSSGSS